MDRSHSLQPWFRQDALVEWNQEKSSVGQQQKRQTNQSESNVIQVDAAPAITLDCEICGKASVHVIFGTIFGGSGTIFVRSLQVKTLGKLGKKVHPGRYEPVIRGPRDGRNGDGHLYQGFTGASLRRLVRSKVRNMS